MTKYQNHLSYACNLVRLILFHRCFLTVFNKTNDQESWNDSYFTNQSEKITIGLCCKISLYAITFCLKCNFGSSSVRLTINLFRKTSMTEFQIVSNLNRGDTSWKRSFTSTLKLWTGMYMFLRRLRKVLHLNSMFCHLIYCYIFIILHMSVLIEYFNALHLY